MNNVIAELFSNGLKELSLQMDSAAQQKLLDFLAFLQKWNRHYNLTAITDWQKMVSHHLLDSLSIAPFITGEQILDVGSGAGLPGIPLAVYFPDKQWTLLDSNGKKARFLIQAKSELSLPNVTIVHDRVERWQSPQKFHTIVTRAVGSIKEIIDNTQQHLLPGGQWLFMKGEYQHEELATLPFSTNVQPLAVPGVLTPRYLIKVITV